MKTIRLFTPKIESFNLVFPIPFLLIGLIEAFHFFQVREETYRNYLLDVSLILFLNYLHVFFTPFFIAILPRGRNWLMKKCQTDKSHYWLIFIILIAFYRYFIYPGHRPAYYFDLAFTVFLEIFAVYHNASQTFGLSLLYNKRAKNENLTSQFIQKTEKFERIIFYSIFTLITFGMVGKRSFLGEREVFYIMIGTLLMTIAYLTMVYKQTESIFSNKFIYCLRFLLYPLTLGSFFATIGILSFHGIEYLFVTQKMIKNEKSDYRFHVLVFFFFLLFVVAVYYHTLFLTDTSFLWFPFQYLNAFFSMFILLHYWLDGILFKSKNKFSREYVLESLVNSK